MEQKENKQTLFHESRSDKDIVLQVEHARRTFRSKKGEVKALDDISLKLHKGEILGIVGESGSGKSTLLRHIACLEKLDEGKLILHGKEYTGSRPADICGDMQMIFQNANASFDPHMTIRKSIAETLAGVKKRKEGPEFYDALAARVGLNPGLLDRYPGHLSGGQCQRLAISRALTVEPEILLCDEITSALDVSVQATFVSLLLKLREENNLSILFVTHDLALVASLCDRVMVLRHGKCVEEGNPKEVMRNPSHEYTKLLIDSIL